jgi:transcription antitermination factor NusG
VAGQWRQAGLDFWLPQLRLRRRWSDRYVFIDEPLFAGYLFLHGDAKARELAVRARGVVQFVGFGRGPTPVPEEEIMGVRRAIESGLRCDPCPYLRVGQEVEVARGPLRGQRGILERKQGGHQLILSVHLIGRSVAIEVSLADVRAC